VQGQLSPPLCRPHCHRLCPTYPLSSSPCHLHTLLPCCPLALPLSAHPVSSPCFPLALWPSRLPLALSHAAVPHPDRLPRPARRSRQPFRPTYSSCPPLHASCLFHHARKHAHTPSLTPHAYAPTPTRLPAHVPTPACVPHATQQPRLPSLTPSGLSARPRTTCHPRPPPPATTV